MDYGISFVTSIGVENEDNHQAFLRLKDLVSYFKSRLISNVELIVSECGSNDYYKSEIKNLCENENITFVQTKNNIFSLVLARNNGAKVANYSHLGFIDVDLRFSDNFFSNLFSLMNNLNMKNDKKAFFSVPVFYLTREFSMAFMSAENKNDLIKKMYFEYIEGRAADLIEFYSPISSLIIVNKYHFLSCGGNNPAYSGHGFEDFDLLYRLMAENNKISKPSNYLVDKRNWDTYTYDGLRSYFSIMGNYARYIAGGGYFYSTYLAYTR